MTSASQNGLLKILRRAVVAFVVLVVFCIITFFAAVRWMPYPAAELRLPASSTRITDRNGNTIGLFPSIDGNWYQPVSFKQISPFLLDAIVAVEDQRFYQHGGVDWKSAASAVWQDAVAWRYRRGASTLTMQLEHLRQPASRSLSVKLMQAVRACQIEMQQSKQQTLVEYLNRAPFGGNLVGAGAASWRYFGKKCADLTLGQAALLAGIPQSPMRLRPDRYPDVAMARRDHVLERMAACGMITETQQKQAAAEPVDARWLSSPQDAPNQIALLPTLARLAQLTPGTLIRTMIDPSVEQNVSQTTEDQLKELNASHLSAAAIVVLDTHSGQCLAVVSRALDKPARAADVDFTVQPRVAGSMLTPLIYAAAFDAGLCTPQTILADISATTQGDAPLNEFRQFSGPMPAAQMLSQNCRAPAKKLLSAFGIGRANALMQGMGLPDLGDATQSAQVTPMELAQAYAVLARGGIHLGITLAVETNSPANGSRIFRQSSCTQVLECLADVGRTRRVCPEAAALGPAWMADSGSGQHDAWCAAVTPEHTIVVWLKSDALVGERTAAVFALRILTAIESKNDGAELASFAPPADFVTSIQQMSAQSDSVDLAMLSPVNHQRIVIDNRLRVPLRARTANSAADDLFWWMVDGQCVGSCHNDQALWWNPTAGPHEIRVVTAAGQAVTANVEVKNPK